VNLSYPFKAILVAMTCLLTNRNHFRRVLSSYLKCRTTCRIVNPELNSMSAEKIMKVIEDEVRNSEEKKSDFVKWLHSNASFYRIQLLAFLAVLGAFLEPVVHIKELFTDIDLEKFEFITIRIVEALQCLFILFVILVLNRKSFHDSTQSQRYKIYHSLFYRTELSDEENKAVLKMNELNIRIFARYWLFFWQWLFLLYVVLFSKSVLPDVGKWVYPYNRFYYCFSNVLETFLNNFSMCNLLICFILIQSPLGSLKFNSSFFSSQFDTFFAKKKTVYGLTIAFSVIHVFVLVWALGNSVGHGINESIININSGFKVISGIFNCCAVALLIARLDSKIANVPSALISVLVLYAALQPMYVFFDDPKYKPIEIFVLSLTLCLKIYFYIIVAYIINTGRLSDLFMAFPLIKKLVETDGYKKEDREETMTGSETETIDHFTNKVDMMNKILEISGFKIIKRLQKADGT